MNHSTLGSRRRPAAVTVVGGLLAALAVAPLTAAVAQAGPVTTTFGYTGASQSFTVPAGITSLTITADGGHGGQGETYPAPPGGAGGHLTTTFAVRPDDVLGIDVGGDAVTSTSTCSSLAYYVTGCGGWPNGGNTYYSGGGGGGARQSG